MRRKSPQWRELVLLVALTSCSSATEVPTLEPIIGTSPRQFVPISAPEILKPVPDSAFLLFAVTAPDSTYHLGWRPTEILVETDRGYRESILLPPHRCLIPRPIDGVGFPFNFTWWSCTGAGINTNIVLSNSRLKTIADLVSGRLIQRRNFLTQPGAHYRFRVPPGIEATGEAVARLTQLPEVEEAFRLNDEPLCYISDIVPPPPCDPWWLQVRLWFTFGAASGDTLPVGPQGWVRATYTQSDGVQRITTYRFDE